MARDMWDINSHYDVRRLSHKSNQGEENGRECRRYGANIAVRRWWRRCRG